MLLLILHINKYITYNEREFFNKVSNNAIQDSEIQYNILTLLV